MLVWYYSTIGNNVSSNGQCHSSHVIEIYVIQIIQSEYISHIYVKSNALSNANKIQIVCQYHTSEILKIICTWITIQLEFSWHLI